jgi:hypothetical protein
MTCDYKNKTGVKEEGTQLTRVRYTCERFWLEIKVETFGEIPRSRIEKKDFC